MQVKDRSYCYGLNWTFTFRVFFYKPSVYTKVSLSYPRTLNCVPLLSHTNITTWQTTTIGLIDPLQLRCLDVFSLSPQSPVPADKWSLTGWRVAHSMNTLINNDTKTNIQLVTSHYSAPAQPQHSAVQCSQKTTSIWNVIHTKIDNDVDKHCLMRRE